jgi:hypothetical protein
MQVIFSSQHLQRKDTLLILQPSEIHQKNMASFDLLDDIEIVEGLTDESEHRLESAQNICLDCALPNNDPGSQSPPHTHFRLHSNGDKQQVHPDSYNKQDTEAQHICATDCRLFMHIDELDEESLANELHHGIVFADDTQDELRKGAAQPSSQATYQLHGGGGEIAKPAPEAEHANVTEGDHNQMDALQHSGHNGEVNTMGHALDLLACEWDVTFADEESLPNDALMASQSEGAGAEEECRQHGVHGLLDGDSSILEFCGLHSKQKALSSDKITTARRLHRKRAREDLREQMIKVCIGIPASPLSIKH